MKAYTSLAWYRSFLGDIKAQNASQTNFWRADAIKQIKQELHSLIPEKPFLQMLDESNSPQDLSIFLAAYMAYYYEKYSVVSSSRGFGSYGGGVGSFGGGGYGGGTGSFGGGGFGRGVIGGIPGSGTANKKSGD
jgi:uncharacterized membrane protein YgcG